MLNGQHEPREQFGTVEASSCISLARAKILTLLQDLGGKIYGEKSSQFKIQNDARQWFFSPKSDFEAWCDMAGLNPSYVRERAREIQANGLPEWRAPAGQGDRYDERLRYRQMVKQREGLNA